MSRDDSGVKYGWAILVTLPTGYKSHDYNVIAADDGVTPVIFAPEEEAHAAATGPKYGPLLARIDYPWRIAVVTDPFPYYWLPEPEVAADSPVLAGSAAARSAAVAQARQIGVDAPLDLMEERNRLRYVIAALGRDLSFTSIPVVLRFLDNCGTPEPSATQAVPTDIACALWEEGLPALRDALDAALDPARQVDAVFRLGLPRGFRPNVAVMVYQFWPVPEVFDGRLTKRKQQSYKPIGGVPQRMQEELRAHGCVPIVAEWVVLRGTDWTDIGPVGQPRYAQL
jgi:hypothetical protein